MNPVSTVVPKASSMAAERDVLAAVAGAEGANAAAVVKRVVAMASFIFECRMFVLLCLCYSRVLARWRMRRQAGLILREKETQKR